MRQRILNLLRSCAVNPSGGAYFEFLDGLRGIAILLVVLHHAVYYNPLGGKLQVLLGKIVHGGSIGVPVFFVLSGFVISYPFCRQRIKNPRLWYIPGYVTRRAFKVYPPFVLSILLFCGWFYFKSGDSSDFLFGLKWLVGWQNFFAEPVRVNGDYWSLIVEMHFYVVLPFLFLLTRGLKAKAAAFISAAVLYFVPFLARILVWTAPTHAAVATTRFPCLLDFFAWGVLFSGVYLWINDSGNDVRRLAKLGYVGFAGLFVSLCVTGIGDGSAFSLRHPWLFTEIEHNVSAISAFLMLFFAFDPASLGGAFLATPLLRLIGFISFEWYLFHHPIVTEWRRWMKPCAGDSLKYVAVVMGPIFVSLLFSFIVYRFFSLPILRSGRRRGPTSPSPAPAAQPAPQTVLR